MVGADVTIVMKFDLVETQPESLFCNLEIL